MTHSAIPRSTPPATTAPVSHAHEGLRAGALGAAVVWLWWFVADLLNRTPLRLPAMFGHGILGLAGAGTGPTWQAVVAFTIAHFAYWCLLSVITMSLVHAARGNPSVLALGAIVFILFQFLFVGITAILAREGLGVFAWPSILLGNLAGWAATWWFILRRHPEIRTEAHHIDDRD